MCRRKASKHELLRMSVVKGLPMWDYKRRLPGRGAYVCFGEECLEKARHNFKGCINRAFRGNFSAEDLVWLQKIDN